MFTSCAMAMFTSRARRRCARAALAVLLLSPCSPPAPALARAKDSAKRAVQQGERLFRDRHFDQALDAFTVAFEGRPSAILLFNIAQCHRQMGREREALATFERVRAEFPKSPVSAEAQVHSEALKARQAAREVAEQQAAERQRLEAERQRLTLDRQALEVAKREQAALPTPVAAPSLPVPPPSVSQPAPAPPLYRRGAFWGAVGGAAAVALGVGLGVGLGIPRSGGGSSPPATDLGNFALNVPSLGRFQLK